MPFPNKVTTYSESVISKFPNILSSLANGGETVLGLYQISKKNDKDLTVSSFVEALDCLFYLKKIQYDENGGFILLC
jgi:hypothetical protein